MDLADAGPARAALCGLDDLGCVPVRTGPDEADQRSCESDGGCVKKAVRWILAFLLTGSLAFLGASWAYRRAVAPALKDGGTPASPAFRARELEMIREKVNELAAIHGFQAGPVMNTLTDEVIADLDIQAAAWWNTLLAEGTAAEEPQMITDSIREQLSMDEGFIGGDTEADADRKISQAESAIERAVVRTVLPMRGNLMTLAMTEAGKRVDLPSLVHFATGIPLFLLALCFLLSGGIACMDRRLSESLRYIGSAMGGGALLVLCILALRLLAPVHRIIGEASGSLLALYGDISSGITLRMSAFSAILLVGCVVCLILWRRNQSGTEEVRKQP